MGGPNIEIIIAQFPAICTGNFGFFSPQPECGHPTRGLARQGEMLENAAESPVSSARGVGRQSD